MQNKIVRIQETSENKDFRTEILKAFCKKLTGVSCLTSSDVGYDQDYSDHVVFNVRQGDTLGISEVMLSLTINENAMLQTATRRSIHRWFPTNRFGQAFDDTIERYHAALGSKAASDLVGSVMAKFFDEVKALTEKLTAIDNAVLASSEAGRSFFFYDGDIDNMFLDDYYQSFDIRWQVSSIDESGLFEVRPTIKKRAPFSLASIHITLDGRAGVTMDEIPKVVEQLDKNYEHISKALGATQHNNSDFL